MRILIIDDDARYKEIVTAHLVNRGFEVHDASTAELGAKMILKQPYDLLIVDGTLPDDNGINLIERVRAQGNRVPVAFVSAMWKDERTIDKLKNELGVNLVKAKPINAAELCQEIMALLGNPEKKPANYAFKPATGGSGYKSVDGGFKLGDGELKPAAVEKLKVVRRKFMQDLPTMLSQIRQKAFQAKNQKSTNVADLILLVHNLKGTAGMNGYEKIGYLMDKVETRLHSVKLGGSPASMSELWKGIDEDLDRADLEI